MKWSTLAWVALGGALGSSMRYAIAKWIAILEWRSFPWATLSVNLLGCFLIGMLMSWSLKEGLEKWLPFLVTGFLGGFTTFSAFGWESFQLLRDGQTTTAILYMSLSMIAGLLFVMLGVKLVS